MVVLPLGLLEVLTPRPKAVRYKALTISIVVYFNVPMVIAIDLNKNSDKEDPTLKRLLDGYWKADPSIRGGYASKIEMYLQGKAGRERAGQGQRSAQDRARGLTDENIWKLIEDGAKVKPAIERGDVTKKAAIERFRKNMQKLDVVKSGNRQPSNAREDEAAVARIRAAVAAGEMTREEAGQKLREIRERMSEGEQPSKEREDEDEPEESAILRIVAGVEEGKISKEKAAEMIASLNKGIEKDDPTIKRQLEMATEFKGSSKWFAQAIEKYLESKASEKSAGQEGEAKKKDKENDKKEEDK